MHRKESDRGNYASTLFFERLKTSDKGNCAPTLFFERLKTSDKDNYALTLFSDRVKTQHKQRDKENYGPIQILERPKLYLNR